MGEAKKIVLRPIPAHVANPFVRRVHYSGKTVNNSQLHIGVYYKGRLEGVMQFGPPLDRRKIMGLVRGTKWQNVLELNRMAFTDTLPRNSESRAIAIAMRLLRKHAPQVKWVVSFADGTQCGDGTIYRAAGFILTAITPNKNLARKPDGTVVHKMTFESNPVGTGYAAVMKGKNSWREFCKQMGWEILTGYQLRYIYFVDPTWRDRLLVPEIPYSEIEKRGARMYRGQKIVSARQAGGGAPVTNRS